MNKKFICLLLISLGLLVGLNNYTNINKTYATVKTEQSLENMYFNKWKGKSWLTLGDSITKAGGYQKKVNEKLKFSQVHNLGENGQTMSNKLLIKSTYKTGKDIDYSKYDLVTIFIGTNDFRYNKELGKIKINNSYDEDTFAGSYQLLIENILKSNPNINLVLITPTQRIKDGYDINFKNNCGNNLIDYVNIIKSLGEMYSLPVLDLYSQSGICKQNMDTFTRDGLHPNDAGYERISEKMYRFLLSI